MKKAVIWLFVMMVGLQGMTAYASNDNTYYDLWQGAQEEVEKLRDELDDATKGSQAPNIKMVSQQTYEVSPGSPNTIQVTIRNVGNSDAQNVLIQASPADGSKVPFSVRFTNNDNYANVMSRGASKNFDLTVTMDNDAPAGTYAIDLSYSYTHKENANLSSKDTIYLTVKNDAAYPKVSLSGFQISSATIQKEQTAVITAELKNTGVKDAHDVQIVVDGLSAREISMKNSMSNMYFDTVKANGSQNIEYTIEAGKDIKSGNYPLTFKVTYKDNDNKEYTNESTYYVSVSGADTEKGNLEITNMVTPSGTYGVDQNFNIRFDLLNKGPGTAKNIKITAIGPSENEVVPKSSSVQVLNSLAAGSSSSFQFSFAGTSLAAKDRNYSIEFKVEYEDGSLDGDDNEKTLTFSQFAGVNIHNPDADDDDDKVSTPKIIVSKFESNPIIVNAGDEFDLFMTFLNTHPEKTVKNVKIFLTLFEETDSDDTKTGNIFTPVNASNTFYVDSIAPKSSLDQSIRLYTVPDAQPKNYTLTVNFEYEDLDNNAYEAVERLGINVTQPTKITADVTDIPSFVNAGEPIFVSFEVINEGNVTVNNLKINVVGEFSADTKSQYIGQMESGMNEYYDNTLFALEPGMQTLDILIEYDTPSGEHIEMHHEFEIEVAEMMMGDMEEWPTDMEMQGSGLSQFFKTHLVKLIVGGVCTALVVGGIIAFVLLRRRKKKQQMEGLDFDE